MHLDNTIRNMATEGEDKKSGFTSFRLSPEFRQAADSLSKTHGTDSLSDYFRGLIYLDAMLAGIDTDPLDKPAWVTKDYGPALRIMGRLLQVQKDHGRPKVVVDMRVDAHAGLEIAMSNAPKEIAESVALDIAGLGLRYSGAGDRFLAHIKAGTGGGVPYDDLTPQQKKSIAKRHDEKDEKDLDESLKLDQEVLANAGRNAKRKKAG